SSRLLDQLPRLSAQSTRHTDGLVGDEPAHADVVEPIAVDDDAVLALVQRATAVGALRDRDLEDDGRDRAAATRARRCALDGWIGGEAFVMSRISVRGVAQGVARRVDEELAHKLSGRHGRSPRGTSKLRCAKPAL